MNVPWINGWPEPPLCREGTEHSAKVVLGTMALAGIFLIGGCITSPAQASEINMHKIMMIESGGRNVPSDVQNEHAIGIYQITPIVLQEWNNFHKKRYAKKDLWNIAVNAEIATWYMTVRIPQMLRAYGKPVTVKNQIIAWNAGINYVRTGKEIPRITKEFLRKYANS